MTGDEQCIYRVTELLKVENCPYVVDAALPAFSATNDNVLLTRLAKVLLDKSINIKTPANKRGCLDDDESFYFFSPDYPVQIYIFERIVDRISSRGSLFLPLLEATMKNAETTSLTKSACATAVRKIAHRAHLMSDMNTISTIEGFIPILIKQVQNHDDILAISSVAAIGSIGFASGKIPPELKAISNDRRFSQLIRRIAASEHSTIEASLKMKNDRGKNR